MQIPNMQVDLPRLAAFKARRDDAREVVGVDALRFFPQLVHELGGDPLPLLRRAGIDPAMLDDERAVLEYRSFVRLMELAARMLDCPSFGLRLAAGRSEVCQGPLGLAMKNSRTLGDAIAFCIRNCHAFSAATHLYLERHRDEEMMLRVELMPGHTLDKRQAIENALLRANLTILEITAGSIGAREAHFGHIAMSDAGVYPGFFGCPVFFGGRSDGIVLSSKDLDRPTPRAVAWMYEMASSFIEARYPRPGPCVAIRVRRLIVDSLGTDACTNDRVAAALCMHPRTLHRRLRAEGTSFEDVRSDVRREAVLRHLREGLPVARIAEMLGFADASVLARSCYRWFSGSPRQLRKRLGTSGGGQLRACQTRSSFAVPAGFLEETDQGGSAATRTMTGVRMAG